MTSVRAPETILLVDDDPSLRRVVEYQLSEAGYEVRGVESVQDALDALGRAEYDLVVTDLLMPGRTGLDLVESLRGRKPEPAVLVITAHGDVATAVRAMQLGALDFLEKPFARERLLVAVGKAMELVRLRDENRRLRAFVSERGPSGGILGSSPALRSVLADLERAAETDATVLLLGESGTGKELAARAIHLASRRRAGPFVVVNCAAIPEGLLESELFGHRKGAFTGAVSDTSGKFEVAAGGTIFLDEIGELPLAVQPKLLRVLEDGVLDKVGDPSGTKSDARVVAATHRDLDVLVREGAFREDLYYRLSVVPLRMPPLRERREDIPALIEHLLAKQARRHDRAAPALSTDAIDRLVTYDWPGNVRELENLLERFVVLQRGTTIEFSDLPEPLRRELPRYGGARLDLPAEGIVLEEVERGLIEEALRRSSGNQSAAARFLGLTRQTLVYRMQKFGLK
jgi:two-component system NtrC family response regulator